MILTLRSTPFSVANFFAKGLAAILPSVFVGAAPFFSTVSLAGAGAAAGFGGGSLKF